MKKVLLGLGLLLLVLAVVAYFFGPTLLPRFFSAAVPGENPSAPAGAAAALPRGVTPWGKVTAVEAMDSYQEEGMPVPIRPERGHQLWVVRVDPNTIPPAPPVAENQPADPATFSRGNPKESFLVDTTGEKHAFLWGSMSVQSKATDKPGWVTFDTRVELMTYSVPRDRRPRALELGDGSRVELP